MNSFIIIILALFVIIFFTFKVAHFDPMGEAQQQCRQGKDNPFLQNTLLIAILVSLTL